MPTVKSPSDERVLSDIEKTADLIVQLCRGMRSAKALEALDVAARRITTESIVPELSPASSSRI